MRVLSSAFYRLKTIIPWVPHDTKLSKLDTLRLARNYIAYLTATLDGQPVNEITNKMPHPQKMVRNSFVWIVCKQNEVKLFGLFLTIVEQAHPGAPRHTPRWLQRLSTTFPSSCHSRPGRHNRSISIYDFHIHLLSVERPEKSVVVVTSRFENFKTYETRFRFVWHATRCEHTLRYFTILYTVYTHCIVRSHCLLVINAEKETFEDL